MNLKNLGGSGESDGSSGSGVSGGKSRKGVTISLAYHWTSRIGQS